MTTEHEPPADRTEVVAQAAGPVVAEHCPVCGVPRRHGGQYCESCRFDFTAANTGWSVVVTADRAYFARHAPDQVSFPGQSSPRVIALDRDEMHIGRSSQSREIQPDIDLAGPPADPGVSHVHAVLVRADDGSYAVIDRGSTNGTTLNDCTEPIESNVAVRLTDGDRIHVGAWTTLEIRVAGRLDG